MTRSESLRSRLWADLTANMPVTVTAVVFALVAMFGLALSPLADSGGGFLLALSVVHVAHLYEEYWPDSYEPRVAVGWAVAASTAVACVFVGVSWGVGQVVGPTVGAVAALLSAVGVQYGALVVARL